jgi:hypothetical protein
VEEVRKITETPIHASQFSGPRYVPRISRIPNNSLLYYCDVGWYELKIGPHPRGFCQDFDCILLVQVFSVCSENPLGNTALSMRSSRCLWVDIKTDEATRASCGQYYSQWSDRSRYILDARITANHRRRHGDMKTTDFLAASFLCTNTAWDAGNISAVSWF